ncbi:KAP family P-loop NTPase fold protein [Dermacoccus nishinomiyaensis]|uniref:KAP family P-loop NTPase fold protein n=1 Tax=Dermacoccus nishinomiyaensis TaxID=1274 RepID=UPI0013F41058|nr:P-loop NTPase fold protein [Dermacoccus nishinomiyaensis]NHC30875.1 hypothetical protein [Dermacoccus nishinomiyaensis]
MSSSEGPLWRDKPIESLSDDSLGRESFVQAAADIIARSWSPDESTVIGLLGPWGSGKTSLINLIEGELTGSFDDWHVAHFTPWSSSDEAGVMAEFYAAITAAIPDRGRDKFRKAASELIGIAAPLASFVPYAGGVVQGAAKWASETLAEAKPWHVAFGEASAELRKQGLRILVVVDDVDRLQGAELAEVLKVVRLLGRFPGVQYLLSYDEGSVQEALAATTLVKDAKAASLFMEKIVQHPLRVPAVGTRARMNILRREIGEAVRPWEEAEGELYMSRVGSRLPDMARAADTLRTINRFGASLRIEFSRHRPGEVDAEDLILLTYLSVREPLLFRELPRFSAELISGTQGEYMYDGMAARRDAFNYKKAFDRLIDLTVEGPIDSILQTIFPALKSANAHSSAPRVGCADYFDRYFAGGVGAGDVGDRDVAAAFEEMGRGETAAIQNLVNSEDVWDDDWVLLVFSKFPPPESCKGGRPVELLRALCSMSTKIPLQKHRFQSAHEWLRLYVGKLLEACLFEWRDRDVADAIAPALIRDRWHWVFSLSEVIGSSNEQIPTWFRALTHEVADATVDYALRHLELGDEAPVDESIWWQFVLDHGRGQALKARLQDGLGEGKFTAEDLAARFVNVAYVIGPHATHLEGVDREAWQKVAPPEVADWCAQWDTPPPPGPAVDYPNTWPSRREFARGRLGAPPAFVDGNASSGE